MNLVILAAGKEKKSTNNLPKCLSLIDNETVLDKLLNISKENCVLDINIVGGFEILQIMEKYPNLKYFYNERWEKTKSLFSFSKAFSTLINDTLLSYSDIIHNSKTINLIDKNKINIFYDSLWQTRYESRDTQKLEKISNKEKIIGEYAGLLYIPKDETEYIKNVTKKILNFNENAILLDLINIIIYDKDIKFIDVNGNWAELDSIQDMEHFKFGTKAETLNKLKIKIKKSEILEQYTFTVADYVNNSNKIVDDIQNRLLTKLLAVRSSALNEDTKDSSMAGNYESILKVQKDDDEILNNSIKLVIESYKKNNQEQNDNNQILVQPYLDNVTMSGVVFSKNLQTSSPYYTINYDKSSDTESVTSGNGNDLNTFICYNNFNSEIKNKNLLELIEAVKEIESITKYDAIDVEFAFANDKLYILQVRPIAAKKDTIVVSCDDISIELDNIKSFLETENNNLVGNKKAYGVMPDWNPAEIIGINPRTLSFDLYKYIITDNIWATSRKLLGYRNVKNCAGLVSFSGKPYVDIKMSFNTFIPEALDSTIATKLVDYFISKLEEKPENHDKVEFNVAITAYDFNFDNKIKELLKFGFAKEECKIIQSTYKNLTQNIILENEISIKEEINKTMSLSTKREYVLKSNTDDIDKVYNLLEDCKKYGTLPFANLARLGFVGSIFLKSLLSSNIIQKEEYDNFFKSINTVAKEFIEDFNSLLATSLTKNDFINKYAHLRPGTYDITSKSYKDGFDDYIDYTSNVKENIKEFKFEFSKETKEKISNEIIKHKLEFTTEQLLNFIIKATEAREKAKFEFTKSLSAIIELISKIGDKYNLTKDDLSYLNLYELLQYKNSSSRIYFNKNIKQNISYNKQKFLITSAIQLPELIFNKDDVDMFFYPSSKPNFVSHHSLTAQIIYLKESNQMSIENKIVLIENADPGFDWIFSHNIQGLVTKYGGAASHMAIRCAEFDLPAAIGCGDKIFNDLVKYSKIKLDCINQKIKGIS